MTIRTLPWVATWMLVALGCSQAPPRPEATPPPIRDGFATVGPATPDTGGSGVIFATTTLECGGKRYEVSTGTNTGKCTVTYGTGGKATMVDCDDSGGQGSGNNFASASCNNGCGDSKGGGSCKVATAK